MSFLLMLCSCDINSLLNSGQPIKGSAGKLTVRYVDVGQGNCSIITLPDGKSMMIDSGDTATKDYVVKFSQKLDITKFDFIVASHPHSDHIGGFGEILRNFSVGTFYMPKISEKDMPTTRVYENLLDALENNGCDVKEAKAGTEIYKSEDVLIQCLSPADTDYGNLNNYSAVIKITYGKCKFMFMGDAEKQIESKLVNSDFDISADVIAVGHHGSSTASNYRFLEKVSPKIAVISVGADNTYGHPHASTLSSLKSLGVKVLRTDTDGTITITSNNQNIKIE